MKVDICTIPSTMPPGNSLTLPSFSNMRLARSHPGNVLTQRGDGTPEPGDLALKACSLLSPDDQRIVGDLFNTSKYSLDTEMTVRYEWRGTSQSAWPSVSGLAPPGQHRKVCIPHAAADLTSARPPGSATPTGADLTRLGPRFGAVPRGKALTYGFCRRLG
jgi:hypothetical protein